VAGRPAAAMNATERQPNRHAGVDAAAGIEGEGGAPKELTRRDSRRRGRRTDAGVALEKTYGTDALTRAEASRCCFFGPFWPLVLFFRPLSSAGCCGQFLFDAHPPHALKSQWASPIKIKIF
jgi:hypothetical protein